MKFFKRASKKQQTIYLLAGLVAILAVVIILMEFSTRDAELARVREDQKRIAERERMITDSIGRIATLSAGTQAAAGFTFNSAGLYVTDQEPGNAVIIDTAVLTEPGFVVIYMSDTQTQPAEVLSTSYRLDKGAYRIVSIASPQAMQSGQNYFAAIHSDTNKSGAFEATDDLPLKNDAGSTLFAQFTVAEASAN